MAAGNAFLHQEHLSEKISRKRSHQILLANAGELLGCPFWLLVADGAYPFVLIFVKKSLSRRKLSLLIRTISNEQRRRCRRLSRLLRRRLWTKRR